MRTLFLTIVLIFLQRIGFSQDLDSLRDLYFEIETGNDTLSNGKETLISLYKKHIKKVERIEKGEVYYYIANLYRLQHNDSKAAKYYKRSLSLNFSDSATIYSLIALTYNNNEKYSKSILYYKKSLLLDSLSGMTSYNLANAYTKAKQYDLSVKYFKKAIALNYREEWVYFGLYSAVTQENRENLKSLCYSNINQFGDNVVSRYFLVKYDLSLGIKNEETIGNFQRLKELDLNLEYYQEFESNFE